MDLAYLGTPEAAVAPLRALVAAGHDVRIVVTRADTRRGRGGAMQPSPVKAAAAELAIPVSHRVDDVLDAGVDLGVVVAFGRLIKPHVLERVPMVNVHFSLLPRWRGAAPVERAILAGDRTTGVAIMAVEEGLDTGAVYAEETVEIGTAETADELRARLVEVGTRLLVDTLAGPLPTPRPQTGEATYAAKIEPAELRIDWTRPADEVERLVRVGRAWTTFRGARLQVVGARSRPDAGEAAAPGELVGGSGRVGVGCGAGTVLELLEVKPEGKPVRSAGDWRNGARPAPGERLGG